MAGVWTVEGLCRMALGRESEHFILPHCTIHKANVVTVMVSFSHACKAVHHATHLCKVADGGVPHSSKMNTFLNTEVPTTCAERLGFLAH